jgi:thiol-disulfide isomerase/thioredoxin
MKRPVIWISVLLVGMLVFLIQRAWEGNGPVRGRSVSIGKPAAAFQLNDLAGSQVSLADFKGKVVLLDFWATWCGPCRATMPEVEKLQQEHPDDFVLLAVNLGDSPEQVERYVKMQNLQSRVLLDPDSRTGVAYGVQSIPMQVIIDKEGILRHSQIGQYSGWRDDLWAEIEKLR